MQILQVTDLPAGWAMLIEVLTMFGACLKTNNLGVVQGQLQSCLLCHCMLAFFKHELVVYTISAMGMMVQTMLDARTVSHSIIILLIDEHGIQAS